MFLIIFMFCMLLFSILMYVLVLWCIPKDTLELRLLVAAVISLPMLYPVFKHVSTLLAWFSAALYTITIWTFLWYFKQRVDGSKAWIDAHLRRYKSIVVVMIVYYGVEAALQSRTAIQESVDSLLGIQQTLCTIHFWAFITLYLRTRYRSSRAFFLYNFIVMLNPLGVVLQLFIEFPIEDLYCNEYYNCHGSKQRFQYFLMSSLPLIETLPAVILCLKGVFSEAELYDMTLVSK
ncbi:hypothetical protein BJV82DRAFT_595150, partial [Fennellomyces sp. T-0311]